MPEHIDYLRKLSRVEARHSDRPSLFKAKQLLNEEKFLTLVFVFIEEGLAYLQPNMSLEIYFKHF